MKQMTRLYFLAAACSRLAREPPLSWAAGASASVASSPGW
eukprot:CAMPEP_0206325416 /NCGR_PEP_ID=MMETSP0106_2-20121207/21066_1 /ASSEMBLY_ACC=CAM_ASM_000206 /TAXON_ID=81532 /ORGANISM="Acanthoeca-like sp., Strain 10tr" /LENGTH=39 /DNA_ID= /DNA_START= /DNA_END= /DNA_ORIENTATION=